MNDKPAPCLYLHAPTDDIEPAYCGLGLGYPSQCRECEQYEAMWNKPDEYEIAAWRLVTQ